MSIFDSQSRYRKSRTYEVLDRRKRKVIALTPAPKPEQTQLGEHLLKEGQRLDHLSNFYLEDPNGFWRITEHNDAMLPDALFEAEIVKIPTEI